jgi:hypothetical protein
MLFHLFSPSANAYVAFPGGGSSFGLSTRPTGGTVIDLCGATGNSISRGLYVNGTGNGFDSTTEEDGYDTLNHNDIVTMRNPGNQFITPDNHNIKLGDTHGFGWAQFIIKRVAGNGRIRHGDMVGLGARLAGDNDHFYWLEANPTGQPVKLGGRSRIFGGQSQQFRFLEGNIVLGTANLTVSDQTPPGETLPAGVLKMQVSHEGLPNASSVAVRFTSLAAQAFNFNNGAVHALPAGGQIFNITVPAGSRDVSVPLSCVSPAIADGCARFAAFMGSGVANPRNLGSLTIVDSGMAAWAGAATSHQGTSPRALGINSVAAEDFMRISINGSAMGSSDGLLHTSPRGLTVSVKPGAKRLPPSTRGYAIVVSLTAFPAAGFPTTATTPVPNIRAGLGGVLTVSNNGSFSHNVTFAPFSIRPALDCFCLAVHIVTLGNVMGRAPHYLRRFGIVA